MFSKSIDKYNWVTNSKLYEHTKSKCKSTYYMYHFKEQMSHSIIMNK